MSEVSYMTTKVVQFVGTCVNLPAEDLDAYDETEREIGYGTFVRHVGVATVREIERETKATTGASG